jgi:hypothetical protein
MFMRSGSITDSTIPAVVVGVGVLWRLSTPGRGSLSVPDGGVEIRLMSGDSAGVSGQLPFMSGDSVVLSSVSGTSGTDSLYDSLGDTRMSCGDVDLYSRVAGKPNRRGCWLATECDSSELFVDTE